MIKKFGFAALVGGALFQLFGGCGQNLFGGNTFLVTAILNELLFS